MSQAEQPSSAIWWAENPSAAVGRGHTAGVHRADLLLQRHLRLRGPAAAQPAAGRHQHDSDGCGDPFITPIKLTLMVSFFVAIPICCIRPGPSSPRSVPARAPSDPALVASSARCSSYAGMAFALLRGVPPGVRLLHRYRPAGVTVATDIA